MKRLWFILFFLCSVVTYGHDAMIVVRNQFEFDHMDETIRAVAIAGKKDVLVQIRRGCYTFHDDHIQLKGVPTDVSVTISGKGKVIIYAEGNSLGRFDTLFPDMVYFKKKCHKHLDSWSDVKQCNQLIEVVDSITKTCRLKLIDEDKQVKAGDYIQISQWFYTRRYEVSDIKDGYVYFTDVNLKRCHGGKSWTINYDYVYGKEMPRYRIWHTVLDKGTIVAGKASRFLNLSSISLRGIKIDHLVFMGNAMRDNSALMRIKNVKFGKANIKCCSFYHCHTACVSVDNSSNMEIMECKFYDNSTTCIISDGNSINTHITDCLFDNNSCGWNNTFCINIKGKDFFVARNTFRDFAYGAIGIGEHYGDRKVWVSGLVEDNEFYYSSTYYANYKKHTLMDSGVIYLWTQNDDVTIRSNYIHDYIGMKDNRGIFCDDGAANFAITGNTILRIANSYCIDSRRIKDQHPERFTNNVNITITDNIVDGSIRFEGRDVVNNNCVYGRNSFRTTSSKKTPEIEISMVSIVE